MADVTVRITRLLADIAGTGKTLSVEAATAAEALEALCQQITALRVHIFDDDGVVRRHVNVFVRGELAATGPESLDVSMADGDEVAIIHAVSGGAG